MARRQAATEVLSAGADGAAIATRIGRETIGRAALAFRAVDLDGDGIPDKTRARAEVEEPGASIKDAASGAADAISSLFRHRRGNSAALETPVSQPPEAD